MSDTAHQHQVVVDRLWRGDCTRYTVLASGEVQAGRGEVTPMKTHLSTLQIGALPLSRPSNHPSRTVLPTAYRRATFRCSEGARNGAIASNPPWRRIPARQISSLVDLRSCFLRRRLERCTLRPAAIDRCWSARAVALNSVELAPWTDIQPQSPIARYLFRAGSMVP